MKSKKKVFLTVLCAAALVVASVLGTMAFLTSTDDVENSFTVGNVNITLDEAKVDTAGDIVKDAARVDKNTYKLIPGHDYIKDPTIHVTGGSEDSWIFVKVENGLEAIIDDTTDYPTIAKQISDLEWTALDGVTGVYYKSYTSQATDKDFVVFNNFKVKDDANVNDAEANYTAQKIKVTGYAVQKDGFDTAKAAWDATFGSN